MSLLLRVLFVGLVLCCVAGAAEGPRRYRYSGMIGDRQVNLDLTLKGHEAKGWYTYDRLDRPLTLEGKIGEDDSISLSESEFDDHVTGVFRGRLDSDDERFSGEWSSPDGQKRLSFDLTLAADYLVLTSNPGPTSYIEVAYPHFAAKGKFCQEVEVMLAASANKICADTIGAARKVSHPELINWFLSKTDFDLQYVSDDLISVLVRDWGNAGGMHGSTTFSAQTFWFKDGKIKRVELKDFFRPGSAYVQRLSECAIEDLRRQKASDVVLGSVTAIDREHMQGATITANGISLTFGEYAVGCYVEGCYRVLVPWSRLGDLIDPTGPAAKPAGIGGR